MWTLRRVECMFGNKSPNQANEKSVESIPNGKFIFRLVKTNNHACIYQVQRQQEKSFIFAHLNHFGAWNSPYSDIAFNVVDLFILRHDSLSRSFCCFPSPPLSLPLSQSFVLLPFTAYFSFCSRIDSIICCCVLVLEVMFRSNPHRIYNLSIYVSLRVPEISVERYFFCCSVHRIPFSKARHNLNPIHTLYAYTTSREHADCAVFMHLCKQRVQSC